MKGYNQYSMLHVAFAADIRYNIFLHVFSRTAHSAVSLLEMHPLSAEHFLCLDDIVINRAHAQYLIWN